MLGAYFIKEKLTTRENSEIRYELNEVGIKAWSEADKNLESQIFKIDPKKDTLIETAAGIVFQIKANTFLNKFGEVPSDLVDIEIKEAMNAYDIVKAGLSTTSNGELLETGGMFYINVREGKDLLTIDQRKPISTHVPYKGNKQMSLFDGERKEDGSINWINPKRMKKQLTTVNVLSLNFYPPNFLDSLKHMGFNIANKKLTDSVYYSFSNLSKCDEYFSSLEKDSGNISMTGLASYTTASPSLTYGVKFDSEKLFRQNCAPCHEAHSNRMLTGPGLKDVLSRVPSRRWMRDFILNNEKMIKAGDSYANKIFKQYGKASMSVFEGQLNDADVEGLIDYIAGTSSVRIPQEENSCIQEINPSRIRAIWDRKFNNTIIATKEFEKRLQIIFKTCNHHLLDLYLQNLDKEMYVIDSIAADIPGNSMRNNFLKFYEERNGGLCVTDNQNRALQEYFKTKKEIYDKATIDALQRMYENETKHFNDASTRKVSYYSERSQKEKELLLEEIDKNLDEAYRQLGKPRPKAQIVLDGFLTAQIATTGWKNVDYYVVQSTVNRTSLNYKDSENGKRAIIEYKETSVSVKDRTSYDRLLVYLIPHKLSSFQLMKFDGTSFFKEKLNMTLQYSIMTVGYKGTNVFFNEITLVQPQPYEVELKKTSVEKLSAMLNSRFSSLAATQDVIDAIALHFFEQEENIRMEKVAKREEIRSRLFKVIYPCASIKPVTQSIQLK